MKKIGEGKLQIGKRGLVEGTIKSLENLFHTHNRVRISVLKSMGHDKEQVRKIAETIVRKLGNKFTFKIIGFKIILKKWRKEKRNFPNYSNQS